MIPLIAHGIMIRSCRDCQSRIGDALFLEGHFGEILSALIEPSPATRALTRGMSAFKQDLPQNI